jgi:hypothetical protein
MDRSFVRAHGGCSGRVLSPLSRARWHSNRDAAVPQNDRATDHLHEEGEESAGCIVLTQPFFLSEPQDDERFKISE